MSIEIPNFITAAGSVQANGVALWASNCTTASAGAGLMNITLDSTQGSAGVDANNSGVVATPRGTTVGMITIEQSTDVLKIAHTWNTVGASANLAFDFIVFEKPQYG